MKVLIEIPTNFILEHSCYNINNDFRYFYFSPFFKRLKEVFNLIETYEERQKNFYWFMHQKSQKGWKFLWHFQKKARKIINI